MIWHDLIWNEMIWYDIDDHEAWLVWVRMLWLVSIKTHSNLYTHDSCKMWNIDMDSLFDDLQTKEFANTYINYNVHMRVCACIYVWPYINVNVNININIYINMNININININITYK